MTGSTKANRAYPSIPDVGGDLPSHTAVLKLVKEALAIHERRTGNFLDSFVRLRELVDLDILAVQGDRIVLGTAFDSLATTDSGDSGGSSGADAGLTYLTATDETALLPSSRRLVAGSNISIDDSTPGQRSISATSSGGVTAHSALTGLLNDDHTQYVLRNILTTNGDIFARVAGVVARIGIGTTGQVLTVVGGLPAWADPPECNDLDFVLLDEVVDTVEFPNADLADTVWGLVNYV